MSTSYDDYSARRRARLSESGRRQLEVLEHAYSIAVQIGALREKHHLTQAQLAQLAHVTQADISRIERGVIHPNEVTLTRIAHALDAEIRLVERDQLQTTPG